MKQVKALIVIFFGSSCSENFLPWQTGTAEKLVAQAKSTKQERPYAQTFDGYGRKPLGQLQ